MPRSFDYTLVARFSATQAAPGGPVTRDWQLTESGVTNDDTVTPASIQQEPGEVIDIATVPPAVRTWLLGRINAKRTARNAT